MSMRDAIIQLLDAACDWPHDPETSDHQSARREHTMAYTNAKERRLAKAIEQIKERLSEGNDRCYESIDGQRCVRGDGHRGNHRCL